MKGDTRVLAKLGDAGSDLATAQTLHLSNTPDVQLKEGDFLE